MYSMFIYRFEKNLSSAFVVHICPWSSGFRPNLIQVERFASEDPTRVLSYQWKG